MKANPNKYYLTVENRVYSLTEKQFQKLKDLIDEKDSIMINSTETLCSADEAWSKALEYIEKVGRYELSLFTMFRY